MNITTYNYSNADHTQAHAFLMPALLRILSSEAAARGGEQQELFDLGCGNGSVGNLLSNNGFRVVGVDPSRQGIEQARKAYPHLRFEEGSTEFDLSERYGRFPIVLSLEVIEHVYAPKEFARRIWDLLEPDGLAIISTPYNGYLKNVCLALCGGMDRHWTALWDHGHIKFWSIKTLGTLLCQTGFREQKFWRVGRIPPLAKSMIVAARKPK